jgi:hypothetical protein
MTALLVGVDPGSESGAAVALDPLGVSVVYWLGWVRGQRGGADVLLTVQGGPGLETRGAAVSRSAGIARTLHQWRPPVAYRLAVEGLFAISAPKVVRGLDGKRKKAGLSPHSQQVLGLAAGLAIGALAPSSVGDEVHRPLAEPHPKTKAPGWRQRQLGLRGRLGADVSEAHAVRMARAALRGMPGVEDLGEHLAPSQAGRVLGAVSEAAWIARDLLTVTL